jgi:hypothetical protein
VTVERRLVTVSALVMTVKTEGPGDVAASFEAAAAKLAELARRRRAGWARPWVPVTYPLTRFEARSEPLPEGAPEPTAGQLRALLDEATRVMANLGRAAEAHYARGIREQAGLEAL